MEGGAVGHNFERDPTRDHPCQVRFFDEFLVQCSSAWKEASFLFRFRIIGLYIPKKGGGAYHVL